MLQTIPTSAIFPREGGPLRKLNPQHVKLLADSIHGIGLQCCVCQLDLAPFDALIWPHLVFA